jgi:hypothetical protein
MVGILKYLSCMGHRVLSRELLKAIGLSGIAGVQGGISLFLPSAAEFEFDGCGDVSDGSHGPAFERHRGFALLAVCAKGDNDLQSGLWSGARANLMETGVPPCAGPVWNRDRRLTKAWLRFMLPHPSQNARRMGHPFQGPIKGGPPANTPCRGGQANDT